MNPVEQLVENFQNLVGQVPELLQPLIVFLAGATPFIEGEGGAIIGVAGGINPIVAAIAAAAGNFLTVFFVVALSSRARSAAVTRRRAARAEVLAGSGVGGADLDGARSAVEDTELESENARPESKGRLRFKRWLVRFGVPGASILGPLAIPTQFTSAILVASGTPRAWVLLWQAVAIVLWTTVSTVSVWLALTYVVGV